VFCSRAKDFSRKQTVFCSRVKVFCRQLNCFAWNTNRFASFTKCFAGDALLNPQVSHPNADFPNRYPRHSRHLPKKLIEGL